MSDKFIRRQTKQKGGFHTRLMSGDGESVNEKLHIYFGLDKFHQRGFPEGGMGVMVWRLRISKEGTEVCVS